MCYFIFRNAHFVVSIFCKDGFVYNSNFISEESAELMSQLHDITNEYSRIMWIAAIAIEVIYNLLADDFFTLLTLLSSRGERNDKGESLLSSVIGVVCDFAVVASSCKSAIAKVVAAAGDTDEPNNRDAVGSKLDANTNTSMTQFVCDYNFEVQRILPTLIGNAREMVGYDIGAAVWTSLNCVLMLWKCLESNTKRAIIHKNQNDCSSLIDDCFAPSLAVIQHFLRRFPASVMICKSTLSGYLSLSQSVLPLCHDGDFKREVVLASLCKLTLPTWGRDDSR
jgi:hypothetical protein